jgi:hypothetical protein
MFSEHRLAGWRLPPVVLLLGGIVLLWSCGEGPTKFDVKKTNEPPDTFITLKQLSKVPLETDTTGALLHVNEFQFTVNYSGVDLDGKVDSFAVKVDDGPWSAWTDKRSVTGVVEFTSTNDKHVISVKSMDNEGAEDPTPATAELTLAEIAANKPPSTAIESGPANGATTASGVTFVVTGKDPDGTVTKILYSVDGGTETEVPVDSEGRARIEFSERLGNLLSPGNHVVAARAVDNLGAVDETPDSRSFFVSSGFQPIIRFQAGPSDGGGWFSSVDVVFSFDAVLDHYFGDLEGFSWAFDDSSESAFTPFTPDRTAAIEGSRVTDGDHFFVLRAKDTSGNVSQEVIRFTAAKATLDQGIIIIDDSNFSENETLEEIFAAAGYPVSRYWDFDGDADNGHPKDDLSIWTPGVLGQYSSVVIFTDNSPTSASYTILLGAYVKAGGNLWLTSYNWSAFDRGFLSEICGIRSVFNNFDSEGLVGLGSDWANPWKNDFKTDFDGITIPLTGSRGLTEILRPKSGAFALMQATAGRFPIFPRAVFADHPAPWGKVVSWGHSLRRTAPNDPGLQAAAAIIFGTYFGE